MALLKPIELESGIVLPEAYFRITEFFVSYKDKQVGMQLACYVDAAARWAGKEPIKVTPYQIFDIAQEAQVSVYELTVSGLGGYELLVSVDGDENVDFSLEAEDIKDLVDQLNDSAAFNDIWTANMVGPARVRIQANEAGDRSLAISGSVEDLTQYSFGRDAKESDFDRFFAFGELDNTGTNPILQCYEYLKTLEEFSGAMNVIK